MAISLLGESSIQTIVQANWKGKEFTFKTLSVSYRWYNKKMGRNQGGSKEKTAGFPSLRRIDWDSTKFLEPISLLCCLFWFLTMQEHSLSLGVSLFAHKSSHLLPHGHRVPTALRSQQSCCRRSQSSLQVLKTDLSEPLKPVQELLNVVKSLP